MVFPSLILKPTVSMVSTPSIQRSTSSVSTLLSLYPVHHHHQQSKTNSNKSQRSNISHLCFLLSPQRFLFGHKKQQKQRYTIISPYRRIPKPKKGSVFLRCRCCWFFLKFLYVFISPVLGLKTYFKIIYLYFLLNTMSEFSLIYLSPKS